jgi:hypothetical protein
MLTHVMEHSEHPTEKSPLYCGDFLLKCEENRTGSRNFC